MILVTHHINLLTNADTIICLTDTKIVFNGKYEDLKTLKDSEDRSSFLRDLVQNEMMEEIFQKFDSDGSGSLDIGELVDLFPQNKIHLDKEVV